MMRATTLALTGMVIHVALGESALAQCFSPFGGPPVSHSHSAGFFHAPMTMGAPVGFAAANPTYTFYPGGFGATCMCPSDGNHASPATRMQDGSLVPQTFAEGESAPAPRSTIEQRRPVTEDEGPSDIETNRPPTNTDGGPMAPFDLPRPVPAPHDANGGAEATRESEAAESTVEKPVARDSFPTPLMELEDWRTWRTVPIRRFRTPAFRSIWDDETPAWQVASGQ